MIDVVACFELQGWVWCGFFLRVRVWSSGVLCLGGEGVFLWIWVDFGRVMKGRVWSVEGGNFEMFLEDGFSCFGLKDDKGAQFTSHHHCHLCHLWAWR